MSTHSMFVGVFLDLRSKFDPVMRGQRSYFLEINNFSDLQAYISKTINRIQTKQRFVQMNICPDMMPYPTDKPTELAMQCIHITCPLEGLCKRCNGIDFRQGQEEIFYFKKTSKI